MDSRFRGNDEICRGPVIPAKAGIQKRRKKSNCPNLLRSYQKALNPGFHGVHVSAQVDFFGLIAGKNKLVKLYVSSQSKLSDPFSQTIGM